MLVASLKALSSLDVVLSPLDCFGLLLYGPWPLRRSRGDGDGCASSLPFFSYAVHQAFSLSSLYTPGHNRGAVTETSLLERTQGGTLDRILTFRHPVLLWGGFSMCRCEMCNRTAVTSVVTGPTPAVGVIQPASCNEAGTHWLSVGKTLVDVPAASR